MSNSKDDLRGKKVSTKEFTNKTVTRSFEDGLYIDIGDDAIFEEKWVLLEDITEINGKPVKFKVWTSIELQCEEEDIYKDIVTDCIFGIATADTFDEAVEISESVSN